MHELSIDHNNRIYLIAHQLLIEHLVSELNNQIGELEVKATLHVLENDKGITFAFNDMAGGTPVPWSDTHDILRRAMITQYEKYGKVYIYTTRDDNFMSFDFDDLLHKPIKDLNKDDIEDDGSDDETEIWAEQQEDLPLYIGFD